MRLHRVLVACVLVASLSIGATFTLSAAGKRAGNDLIKEDEIRQWLTRFASDEFEGRATFTEGLGLAAGYLAEQLKSWNVKPGGEAGSYFQRVRVLGVKSTNRSSVIVEAGGEKRTFKIGEGITLPSNVGAKQTVASEEIEFLGYGLHAPWAKHDDFAGRDVKGKVTVWLGTMGPKDLDNAARRLLFSRSRHATEERGAIATVGPPSGFRPPAAAAIPQAGLSPAPGAARPEQGAPGQAASDQAAGQMRGMFGPPIERADFTTVQRLDQPIPPAVSAQDAFFEFLFKGQQVEYAELKSKVSNREPLPVFTLKGVRITINIDADYQVVRTQYTRNVVGVVEGRDAKLKDTYVAFGAHYDHVGYSEGEMVQTGSGLRRAEPRGRIKEGALDDRYWNGADDDGSGSIAMLSVAKAFALGTRPRRSLIFVWHTGEEKGLYGSRYYADYPAVPIEKTVAEVNMDMVGRNRDDKAEHQDTVYLIGSDRISTELHNLCIDANAGLPRPLKLDFEMNDPSDPEGFYYRSDHYSYARKGIPVVFLTTGLHPDYHANTDGIDKIDWAKMTRITRLVYEVGRRVADLDRPPVRDNLGPRVGKGSNGKLTAQ